MSGANGSGILIAHVRPLACSSTLPLSLRYRRSSAGFGGWCGIRTRGTGETVHHLSRVTPSTTRPTNHARLMQDSNLRNLDLRVRRKPRLFRAGVSRHFC